MEDGELLIEREVLAGGKSRAFLGNRPVTVALLREMAPFLGDIHGQHEQQQLFSPDAQLESAGRIRRIGRRAGTKWRLVPSLERGPDSELEELDRSEQEKLRMADLWSFQRKEIEAAALKPGEDAELEQRAAGACAMSRKLAGERRTRPMPRCTKRRRAPPRRFARR